MENSAINITPKYNTPKMSVVKGKSGKSSAKKSANDKIAINTLAPNFNFINNRGETISYRALKI